MVNKRDFLVLLLVSFLALSLPLATYLVSQSQENRSRAADVSTSKVSFKIAFKGVKPSYTNPSGNNYNCLSSLDNIKVEAVNKPTNTYESNIEASFTPVSGETNSEGDQVFLISNLILDSKFNSVNTFNYLRIKGSRHLASRMCLDNQDKKLDEVTVCDINLSNTNTTVYDFSEYALTPGDINQDGVVNSSDYSVIKNNFNNAEVTCGIQGDLNYDGRVNSLDAGLLKDALSTQEDGIIETTAVIQPITSTPTNILVSNPTVIEKPTNTLSPTKILTSTPTKTPTLTPTNTLAPTPTTASTAIGLKFAVMADIHDNTSGLKKMMNKAKSDGMDIVVLAGDLTHDGTSTQLKAVKNVLDNSGVRYETTEGNHDMRKSLFDDVFGKSFQSIRFNGIKLILIDNSDYRGLDSGVLEGLGQKAWIESEVAECKTIICVGIMHMPLNHPTSDHVMGEASKSTAKEADWLRELLIANGVKEIETGHIHHFKTYTLEGLKTNQVGPGSSSDFSEFTINSVGTISRKEIKL